MISLRFRSVSFFVFAIVVLAGCSIRQAAVNLIGNALSGGGGVYSSDNDPELIHQALPFALKMFEGLLEESPKHRGLLLAAAKGFTGYAFLIQDQADRSDEKDLREAQRLRARARGLYLRGRDYGFRGLALAHPQFLTALRKDKAAALASTTKQDVPFLYWAGVAWAGAISVAKNDPDLLIDLPLAGALVGRVLELDESYDLGAAHEFFVSYEASRPGGNSLKARQHYRKALEISGGQRVSVHLALAENVAIKDQNLSEFRALIAAALAVDLEKNRDLRLVNTISRQRALWLGSRIPDLFLEADEKEKK
jgi:predicted anti-sigma-YlaC factor YlaD